MEWKNFLPPGAMVEDVARLLKERMNTEQIPIAYVALDSLGGCLGTIALKAHDMETHPELTPWLAAFYVREERRNQGIGQQLMDRLLVEAKRMGIASLYLHTPSAAAYYAKRGWRHRFTERYKGIPVSVMEYLV